MRLNVHFGYHQLGAADVAGHTVAVIDVLRSSTTIATALANGAKAVVPFESSEEAVAQAKQLDRSDVRLAGEQKSLPIPGFDLGNSPSEFTSDSVGGRTVLLSTTNGTSAVLAVQGAREIVVAAYVNFSVVAAMLRAATRGDADLAIVCAGQERRFTLEDAGCAGRYVRAIMLQAPDIDVNDAAHACALIDKKYGDNIARLLRDSTHGKALVQSGFKDDLRACAAVDAHPVIPVYRDRQIVRLGEPER